MLTDDIKTYLKSNGWYNIHDNQWVDLTGRCQYECHESVAVQVQQYRDQLPWYKKLIKKIFKL